MTVLTVKAVNKDKKHKKFLQAIIFVIYCDFLMVDQIFLSPKVKRSVIITIYYIRVASRVAKRLELRILGK